jgi:hypothetical protein
VVNPSSWLNFEADNCVPLDKPALPVSLTVAGDEWQPGPHACARVCVWGGGGYSVMPVKPACGVTWKLVCLIRCTSKHPSMGVQASTVPATHGRYTWGEGGGLQRRGPGAVGDGWEGRGQQASTKGSGVQALPKMAKIGLQLSGFSIRARTYSTLQLIWQQTRLVLQHVTPIGLAVVPTMASLPLYKTN